MVLARQAMQFAGIDVSYDKRIEKGHHRTEIREVWSVPVAAIGELYQPQPWAGIHCVVMVVRVRHLWNKTTREVQFYLTSLTSDAQLLGRVIRRHWGIENEAHWTLDVTFALGRLPKSAPSIVRRILPFSDASLSMLLTASRLTNAVSDKKVNEPLWIMITCCKFSVLVSLTIP